MFYAHKYVVLFADGREIAMPPAEDLEIEPRTKGGLRKGRLKLLGGRSATIFLDLDRVLAVYPVAASEDPLPRGYAPQQGPFASGVARAAHEEVERRELERRERESRKKERRAAQSKELDREITAALTLFAEMEDSHFVNPYPIVRNFERRGRVPAEVLEFSGSREVARERLDAMSEEGLVRCTSDGWYRVTEEGAKLAGLGLAPARRGSSSGLRQHFRTMVGLCQAIMASVSEEARWVTDRELLDDAVRTRREAEIGRRLPSGRPSPAFHAWPSYPGGVLILEETGTTSAVGLELSPVTEKKLAHYETMLEDLARDPVLDRVHLVFQEDEALRRVQELAGRYRQDGFFVFRQFRVDDPLSFRQDA